MCKDCGCLTATHPIFSDHNHKHTRQLRVEETLFMQNQRFAEENRKAFQSLHLTVFNVMSSPGSGKTTLLAKILPNLSNKHPLGVIVGDQETDIDSSRLSAAGLISYQINTHSACHLDAHRVGHAVEHLPLSGLQWIVIENVGNLVCPAVFDLGESVKVALLSTPEGEEKPLKYPVLFHDANLIVITKSDLIPHLEFNTALLMKNIRSLNSSAPVIFCSVKTGEGLPELALAFETLAQTLGEVNRVPRNPSKDPEPQC